MEKYIIEKLAFENAQLRVSLLSLQFELEQARNVMNQQAEELAELKHEKGSE